MPLKPSQIRVRDHQRRRHSYLNIFGDSWGAVRETGFETRRIYNLNRTLPIEANDMTNAIRKALREVIQDHGYRLNRTDELQISIKKYQKSHGWYVSPGEGLEE